MLKEYRLFKTINNIAPVFKDHIDIPSSHVEISNILAPLLWSVCFCQRSAVRLLELAGHNVPFTCNNRLPRIVHPNHGTAMGWCYLLGFISGDKYRDLFIVNSQETCHRCDSNDAIIPRYNKIHV